MAIPQLWPGVNISSLVKTLKSVNGWDAFSTFKLTKISRLFDNNLTPEVGNPPGQKPNLKNGTVEFFDGRDAFGRFKLPKISRLFDNNLSPEVADALSQKLYLKNGKVAFYLTVGMRLAGSNYPKSVVNLTTTYLPR
jgi:hypothetical protein